MAEKRNILTSFIKLINSIFAIALLLGYAIPFLEPKNIGVLSVLSIFTPLLIVINSVFVIYWLVSLKKELLISLLTLAIGFNAINRFYNYKSAVKQQADLTIMNYNVRGFNVYNWIKQEKVPQKIASFLATENPDILCIQEYYNNNDLNFSAYKYSYIKGSSKTQKFGQAIFSKYKIINSGSLDFSETANNAIYADIVRDKDTLRIYNIHLQSLKVNKLTQNVSDNKEKLLDKISETNKKQQEQVQQIVKHKASCVYKTVICGDFNNTAYSYSYKELASEMQDAFVVQGAGFGKTYGAFYFPFRIDFILVDEVLTIADFETYKVGFSDHKPIAVQLGL